MLMRLAVLQGAEVFALGKGAERLKQARLFGAHHVIDIEQLPAVPERIAAVRGLTKDRRGLDVVIEAVGKTEVWEESLQLVRKGGKVTFFGGCKRGTQIGVDTESLHYSELRLQGVFHQTPDDYRRSVQLLSMRAVDGRNFVKETVALSSLLEAFKRVKALEGIKFSIDPTRME